MSVRVVLFATLVGLCYSLGHQEDHSGKCDRPLHFPDGRELSCGQINPDKCPENYYCNAHPADQYHQCCPKKEPVCERGRPVVDMNSALITLVCTDPFPVCPDGYQCVDGQLRGHCCRKEPSRCPYIPFGVTGVCGPCDAGDEACATPCGGDGECTGGQICCPNGCDNVCTDPEVVAEPRDPCQGVDCGNGQTCVPQVVNCVRAPCYPQHTCVPDFPVDEEPCATMRCLVGHQCLRVMPECVSPPCTPIGKCVEDPEDPKDPRDDNSAKTFLATHFLVYTSVMLSVTFRNLL